MGYQLTEAKNNATTTLAAAHLVGGSTLSVVDASVFPSTYPYRLTVTSVSDATKRTIYSVTSASGNSLSLGGAIEDTVDQSFPIRSKVEQLVTFGYLQDLEDAINDPRPVASSTTFNADGSITEVSESGQVQTTSFLADGSIVQVYGPPINQTKTTTFNADGSILVSLS